MNRPAGALRSAGRLLQDALARARCAMCGGVLRVDQCPDGKVIRTCREGLCPEYGRVKA